MTLRTVDSLVFSGFKDSFESHTSRTVVSVTVPGRTYVSPPVYGDTTGTWSSLVTVEVVVLLTPRKVLLPSLLVPVDSLW